jgi:hypothetical protein
MCGCARCRDIAGLVAGQFDRPELGRLLRFEHFQQGQADVSGQPGDMPAGAKQVREQRCRRALALGAGTQTVRATTPSGRCSPNHNAVPPMKRVPRSAAAIASGR